MAQESAAILALLLSVALWRELKENAILVFSILWMAGTMMESLILLIYRTEPNTKEPLH